MDKIKQAYNMLQSTGKFEQSQLHEGSDSISITPYGQVIDFQQLEISLAAATLFHLCPVLHCNPVELKLLNY